MKLTLFVIMLASALLAAPTTQVPLVRTGSVNVAAIAASSATSGGADALELRGDPDEEQVNRRIPRSSYSAARVPSNHVPAPAGSNIARTNPNATGFNGLSHLDERLAGSGAYANSQFSSEPPDQGLCVGNFNGNTYVLEAINTALRVYSPTGAALSATVGLNEFLGLPPSVQRTTPPAYGDFISDPKCLFDKPTGRWFVSVLELGVDPVDGDFTGASAVYFAVSQTSNPLGNWFVYKLDTTNDGTNGAPSHKDCPCFGDQPLIGADGNGFYVSTNEFPVFGDGFNGAQIYAMSKASLVAGTLPAVVMIDTGAIAAPDGGTWYTIQPAMSPGSTFAPNTEYFLSALEFSGHLDDRIAVWALTGTDTLTNTAPAVSLTYSILDSQVYGFPPSAEQQDGIRPLAASLGSPKEKLELLDSNDDRMNQVVYADGKLWSALNTVVKTANGPARAGIAWFAVAPSVTAGQVSGTIANQGYVAVNREHAIFPSIAVNDAGKGAMVFTLTSDFRYPSSAYVTIDAVNGTGDVHVIGAGALPEDGFSGYAAFDGAGRVARWGDYSAAAVDDAGNIWMATEYIPNAPRTLLANWGTYVSKLVP